MNNTENTPILSLCIPTNGALHWVEPVIESIYSQECDESLFEVLISDNAKNPELKSFVENYGHTNISYMESMQPPSIFPENGSVFVYCI